MADNKEIEKIKKSFLENFFIDKKKVHKFFIISIN